MDGGPINHKVIKEKKMTALEHRILRHMGAMGRGG